MVRYLTVTAVIVLGLVLVLYLTGCASYEHTLSSFAGARPSKPADQARTECWNSAMADKNVTLREGYVACMAKYGWRVSYN